MKTQAQGSTLQGGLRNLFLCDVGLWHLRPSLAAWFRLESSAQAQQRRLDALGAGTCSDLLCLEGGHEGSGVGEGVGICLQAGELFASCHPALGHSAQWVCPGGPGLREKGTSRQPGHAEAASLPLLKAIKGCHPGVLTQGQDSGQE